MATLLEHFVYDFKDMMLDTPVKFSGSTRDPDTGNEFDFELEVKFRIVQDFHGSSRLAVLYIPETPATMDICKHVITDLESLIQGLIGVQMTFGFSGDRTLGTHQTVFSKRLYIYSEVTLTDRDLELLQPFVVDAGLYVTFRSHDYVKRVETYKKPFAFISHDSRDKDLIARPIAETLHSRLCFVWYDEFSLKVGDGLRESIEKGIKEARKCILVITPNFLANPGWTKAEFNSIFTREIIKKEKILLPIWWNVTKEMVYEYSPNLVDTVALIWPDKTKLTDEQYRASVEVLLSKLHLSVLQ
jgi:hypothetical protein